MPESKPTAPEPTASAPASTPESAPESTSSASTTTSEETTTNTDLKTVHSSPPRDTPAKSRDESTSPSRNELITQATLFLETAEVRDAPLDKKLEFLRSKGLTEEEAKRLASTISSPPISPPQSRAAPAAPSPAPPPPAPVQQLAPVATPPILTYPEFLAPPPPAPAPPAPISASTLFKAAYFASATAATIYTANSFILSPMLNSLTSARLDFASTVSKNLDTLTSKLLELAPSNYTPPIRSATPKPADYDSDDDCAVSDSSSASDPTELFHVDAAVQTSPPNELADDEDEKELGPDGKLEELTSQMRVLVDAHSDGTDNELTFLLEDLTGYLEGLKESGLAAAMYSSPFGGFVQGKEKDKEDPIWKVKQEIRSVKGVLLHTKNFPATRMTSIRRNPDLTS
ncbi:hypothetical protein EX30DRAFT_338721 [Ascodesmis nigricans]|uniref:Peroxisomal membrane protein PEX14 n=1 Tax=Ascodesmis nigricans TaxID=341454 RepID=A0A4V3SJI8_9PEZI|nr:hypothetical protein EX30DRAFT_338721 [Ascodesmis nigricans]